MWLLKKRDGQEFGPVEIDVLARWAANGQISPMDTVAETETGREFAPYEIPELEMIWEVTLDDGAVYGPTHANAIRVFVREGQILPKDTVRDILRGEKFQAGEFELYLEKQYPLAKAEPHPETEIQSIAAEPKEESDEQEQEQGDARNRTPGQGQSKTRFKPLGRSDPAEMTLEELQRRVEELESVLDSEQASYEKLRQHYADLNQRYVALKDRLRAGEGAGASE